MGRDPLDFVLDQLARYEGIRVQLASTAQAAESDSTRVRALTAEMNAMLRQLELMQAAGLLPSRLGQLGIEVDIRATAALIIKVLADHDVPEEAQRAIAEAITAAT